MLKETLAINTITGILKTYEKMKTKLENAINALKETKKENLRKIKEKEERVKIEVGELEAKNSNIEDNIEKASKFKLNIEKMLG